MPAVTKDDPDVLKFLGPTALAVGLLVASCTNQASETRKTETKTHPPLMAANAVPSDKTVCDINALKLKTRKLESEPGIEVLLSYMISPKPGRGAIVLTHGAGSPSSSIWDLNHEDYSLMRRLACEGFDVYGLDVRGFGGSSNPPLDKTGQPGAVRAGDVMVDVEAAVAFAKATSKVSQVDLLGWSWGCVVSGMYASLHNKDIRTLVLFAPVYDRKWAKRHATQSEWRVENKDLFYKYHDPKRESRAVLDLHVQALFQYAAKDGALRLSNGPYFDIYGEDAPIWDAAKVRARTLILRGEKDRASTHEAAYRLFTHLTKAQDRRYIVLPNAGHFAFRTHQYRAFQDEVLHFLTRAPRGISR